MPHEAESYIDCITGLFPLVMDTEYRLFGVPCHKFRDGIQLPETWINEINTNQYWPYWYTKYICPPNTPTYKENSDAT
jgi:hypothetical protein